jgi:hypothetical protein
MMRRKHWVIAIAILLLLVAADVIYWGIASDRLLAGYQAWLAARVAEGWEVRSGPVSAGGWPRAAIVSVPNLTLRHSGRNIPGDLGVASAGLALSVSLFKPSDLHLALTGPLHVQAGDAPDLVVTADESSMLVPLQQTGPLQIALSAKNLRLEPASGPWHLTVGLLSAQTEIAANAPGSEDVQPTARFAVNSEAIGLPTGVKWPLGSNISSLSFDGTVSGKLPKTRDMTAWAELWRDGGGSLEISHLTMGWGPLGLTSSATLALDDQLQPMGSGNGHVVGYAETLDKLAAGGVLTKSAATVAKAVLSLMAGTPDGDAPSAVDVPLTLQYRTLSMRQVPLVRLPELDWPTR